MKQSSIIRGLNGTRAYYFAAFMFLSLIALTFFQLEIGNVFNTDNGLSIFRVFCSVILILLLIASVRDEYTISKTDQVIVASLILFFSILAINDFFLLDDLLNKFEFQIDLSLTSLGLAGGILLWLHISTRTQNRWAVAIILIGISLNLLLSMQDVLDPSVNVFSTPVNSATVEIIESSLKGISLLMYVSALLLSISTNFQKDKSVKRSLGQVLSKVLYRAEFQTHGAFVSIFVNNMHWWMWHSIHKSKTFADFYSWQITRKLDRGRAHRTLGMRRFEKDSLFGSVPEHDSTSLQERCLDLPLNHLFQLGLEPHHTLVDYGCGSLRLGYPLISWLEPDHYWGLDITDRFYLDGMKLIGAELTAIKKPQLRVITSGSLIEVQKARPDFVISIAVLKHVPEEELEDYFNKLCSMVQPQTTLAIIFLESSVEKQISGKSWSWSQDRIRLMIEARCPHHDISIVMRNPPRNRNGIPVSKCMMAARPRQRQARSN